MSSPAFDPYHRWLAIPAKDQPPHHYRLLGLELYESDPDVIATAADQRMAHLRTFQVGANGPLSQQLLNELSTARICLLNPPRKAAYDAELRARLTPPAREPAPSSPSRNPPRAISPTPVRPIAVPAARALPQGRPEPVDQFAGHAVGTKVPSATAANKLQGDPDRVSHERASRRWPAGISGPITYGAVALVIGLLGLVILLSTRPDNSETLRVAAAPEPATELATVVAPTAPPLETRSEPIQAEETGPDPIHAEGADEPPVEVTADAPAERPNTPEPVEQESPAASEVGTVPSATVAPSAPVGREEPIDLLKLIDPDRDAFKGRWTLAGGVLTSPSEPEAGLQFPYTPPPEYTLTIVGQRESGTDLGIGLVFGGRQVLVALDGWRGTISGLATVDGKLANANPSTKHIDNVLGNKQPYTVICDVRKSAITVSVNGVTVIDWSGSPAQLSFQPQAHMPKQGQLFLGIWNAVHHFQSITLVPHTSGEEAKTGVR